VQGNVKEKSRLTMTVSAGLATCRALRLGFIAEVDPGEPSLGGGGHFQPRFDWPIRSHEHHRA
jgi:hypothetical protein